MWLYEGGFGGGLLSKSHKNQNSLQANWLSFLTLWLCNIASIQADRNFSHTPVLGEEQSIVCGGDQGCVLFYVEV